VAGVGGVPPFLHPVEGLPFSGKHRDIGHQDLSLSYRLNEISGRPLAAVISGHERLLNTKNPVDLSRNLIERNYYAWQTGCVKLWHGLMSAMGGET